MSNFGTIKTKQITSGGSLSIIGGLGVEVDGTTVHADIKADSGLAIVNSELSIDLGHSAITGTLTLAKGGTGGTTAAAARTALGVDAAGTDNSTAVTLANTHYLTISGQEITAGTVPVSSGGTGAATAAAARTALGVDAAGTDNSTAVTLANTNYLTISEQEITGGTVPITSGGTGATSVGAARTALGVDEVIANNSTDVTLATVTGNYLTLSGQEITASTVPLSLGGTGAGTAADACNNLGIGENDEVRFKSIGVGVAATSTDGEIIATNDITAFHSSDKRLKTNIQTIQDPLAKLQKIGGYTFDWIPIQGIHSNTGNDVGVIAQEIEEILPEVTTTRDNGYKAVRYEKLTPLLIECIKSQQSQIDDLHDRLSKLEKKIN